MSSVDRLSIIARPCEAAERKFALEQGESGIILCRGGCNADGIHRLSLRRVGAAEVLWITPVSFWAGPTLLSVSALHFSSDIRSTKKTVEWIYLMHRMV